ncbi:histidinol-phosphate transaminase [Burkholderiaceae bacterium FT117]|uniref:histidinol-phosphate transaminase n=1 Tax=Zeimonas sediminis TaxID=2944268 RepID=UPI002342DF75|nr:histidinol-phosphate transaminase [Zeimonas sediminis]MCM5571408.1 histidinol-phosphate transaminase [Zeimonas sediminis]
MSRFWSEIVRDLTPYVPGEQPKQADLIKLNTNENPYPPSPAVLDAIRAELGADAGRLRLYPDPQGTALREAIAEQEGLSADQVFVGNGSDEVLAFAFQALLAQARPLRFPDISYSFYPSYCRLYRIAWQAVPLRDHGFALDVADYPAGGPVILPNPNAPTGRAIARADVARLLAANADSPVVIDEAYVTFGAESAAPLIAAHDNLLVVRTLSKSHALAGMRVGYALGHRSLIEALVRVKDSFNSYPLDRLALAAATAAIRDTDWLARASAAVIESRDQLSRELAALGFDVLPSKANFVFARHPGHDAAALSRALRERAIIVRHFSAQRIAQWLRITVGTPAECEALVGALRGILARPE